MGMFGHKKTKEDPLLGKPASDVRVDLDGNRPCRGAKAAQDGAAVIYISAEVDDLVAVCDRVYVLREGRIAQEFLHPFAPDALIDAMFSQAQEGSHG